MKKAKVMPTKKPKKLSGSLVEEMSQAKKRPSGPGPAKPPKKPAGY